MSEREWETLIEACGLVEGDDALVLLRRLKSHVERLEAELASAHSTLDGWAEAHDEWLAERGRLKAIEKAGWKLVEAEQPILLGTPLDEFYAVLTLERFKAAPAYGDVLPPGVDLDLSDDEDDR